MVVDTVVAFDLYGTLLSTESIVKQLECHFGSDKAQSISTAWRRYQLEYTWRADSMQLWRPFSEITKNALRHALEENGEQLSNDEIKELMKAYDSLSTFPDVEPTLNRVAAEPTIRAVVFSNGTEKMVTDSVQHLRGLAPHASILRNLITADEISMYKPSSDIYYHLVERVGKELGQTNEVWLVSGNPFDVVGALRVGMNAIWIDRAGKGWQDAAAPEMEPTAIVRSLEQIVDEIKSHQDDRVYPDYDE